MPTVIYKKIFETESFSYLVESLMCRCLRCKEAEIVATVSSPLSLYWQYILANVAVTGNKLLPVSLILAKK